MGRELWTLDTGRLDYQAGLGLMAALQKSRAAGLLPDLLLYTEPGPVYTIGRAGSRAHLLWPEERLEAEGIKAYEVDRGGDITYHGPGQLVGYPILDLKQHRPDLHLTIAAYEEALLLALASYGLEAGRMQGHPGVWVKGAKVAAIGIGVRHWVTYHGFALNINPGLGHFEGIVPCGIRERGVTSLERLLGRAPARAEVRERVTSGWERVFKLVAREVSPAELAAAGGEEVEREVSRLGK